MEQAVPCPACGRHVDVSTSTHGQTVTCPQCLVSLVFLQQNSKRALARKEPPPGTATTTRRWRKSRVRREAAPAKVKDPAAAGLDNGRSARRGGHGNTRRILWISGTCIILAALVLPAMWVVISSDSGNVSTTSTPGSPSQSAPFEAPEDETPESTEEYEGTGGGEKPESNDDVSRPAPASVEPPEPEPVEDPVPPKPVVADPPVDPPPHDEPEDPEPPPAEKSIYERLLESTVWVVCPLPDGSAAMGTGSLVDRERRLILTNYHVVDEGDTITVFFPAFDDGELMVKRRYYFRHAEQYEGQLVQHDRRRDLALLQLEDVPDEVKAVPLAPRSAKPSEAVHTVGNPGESEPLWVYTPGTVRQVYDGELKTEGGPKVRARIVDTASAINPGDSGGPVVNWDGALVAVNQSHSIDARLISHCIDISEIRSFIEEYDAP